MRRKASRILVPDSRGRIQLPPELRHIELFQLEISHDHVLLRPLKTETVSVVAQAPLEQEQKFLYQKALNLWANEHPAVQTLLLQNDDLQNIALTFNRSLTEREKDTLYQSLKEHIDTILQINPDLESPTIPNIFELEESVTLNKTQNRQNPRPSWAVIYSKRNQFNS